MAFTPASTYGTTIPAYLTWSDPILGLGEQRFDAVMSESHIRTSVVTEHPVEQGVNVTDHVRPNVDRLTLEVRVTNQPINDGQGAQFLPVTMDLPQTGAPGPFAGGTGALIDKAFAVAGLKKQLGTQQTAVVLTFDGDSDYVARALSTLDTLRTQATLLSVVTPRAFYDNMILESVTMRRSRSNGGSGAGDFSLEFRQIRVVSSSIVDAPLPSIPQGQIAVPQGKKDPTPPARYDNETIAHYANRTNQPQLLTPLGLTQLSSIPVVPAP